MLHIVRLLVAALLLRSVTGYQVLMSVDVLTARETQLMRV